MGVQVHDERAHVVVGAGVQGRDEQRFGPEVRFWTRIAEDPGDGVVGEAVRDAVRHERQRRVAARQAHRAHDVRIGNHTRIGATMPKRPGNAQPTLSAPVSDARFCFAR